MQGGWRSESNWQSVQVWVSENPPDEVHIWKPLWFEPVTLVTKTLPAALALSREEFSEVTSTIRVVSSFVYNKVRFPVYQFTWGDFVFRLGGKHGCWSISVWAQRELEIDFMGLFDPNEALSSADCEGFSHDCVFGPYANNKKCFTFQVTSDYKLFTFFWILAHSFTK